ncbi:P-loop containing nucleoside triphosphate hydrolases superfamily protein [Perilla frutescens var. frutescens]|nr:P-loop containing nucleoside triphosphate hydrolases superfamily protein [Perilla frutescens var. frutescens]
MPVFSTADSTMSALRKRFGYGQIQQPELAESAPTIMKSSVSSPDLLLKSARRDNSVSDDGETTSAAASRSFEFGLDPNFWKEHNVQVIIRLRPLNSSEISTQGQSRCVRQESSQTITWTGHPESRFTFDLVADESVSQEMMFKAAGVPMVENCMEGYNSCMFAYGQTGSGKTHTMLGDIEGGTRRHSVNCGMTPRVFEYLFSRIQKDKDARREEKIKFTCRCSFIEIYNEQILDLLDPSSVNLQIREDIHKGIYVENVNEVEVTSARDVIQQLIQGSANRKVASTNMNRASSRSHSVFTCVIESKWESQGVTHHRFARLNLVDLAGSERQKSSGAEGERLKEATNINKSLSTLGLVIMNLVSISNGRSPHVPYRDSKLTFLLQDSLGGNAKTSIIANISPSSSCSLETLSTLKFAQRAKFIKNHAIINEDASGDVLALRLENQNLKKEVSRLRSLVNGGAESYDGDVLSITFPGSPGTFKWDGHQGFSSPIVSQKKISHKKGYEAALVGALQREKDKDTAMQALAAENQAALRLAKQREDEIQAWKMRLRFRESNIKRLESVASGKISAETHLLKEREELLEEIELLRAQVDRNQEVTRFAMENLRLKEEIRRLKSFCEDGAQERLNEQITVLEKELREALDWKLMHESDCANSQKESSDLVLGTPSDSNFLTSNQESASPWRTSMSEENEFLRMQAIQNQSEIDALHRKIDFLVDEKDKLERHVNDLATELDAERLSKEATAKETQKGDTKFPSLVNIGVSDQTELKTMVDAIAAASEREAEAHEMAFFLSKENDELKMKLKVLIEDNNKLIDLYERAVAENHTKSSDISEIPWQDSTEVHSDCIAKVDEAKEVVEVEKENEKLKCELTEIHEENDKLLSLYEKAMQERDELRKVIASGQFKNADEKLVEIDNDQCLSIEEASVCYENEREGEESNVHYGNTDLDLESRLYEVHVQDDCSLHSMDSPMHTSCDSDEANMESFAEVGKNYVAESVEQNTMEIDEPKNPDEQEESCTQQGNITTVGFDDLKSIRTKLAEAQEKLSYSAESVSMFGSFERAMGEVDALSDKISKVEGSKQAKQQECCNLKVLSSELLERKDLANKKLSALKHSLMNFSSSVGYFEQREALARSRLDASSQHLNRRKENLISLQLSRQELVNALSKIKQTETELRSTIEKLRLKMEEENRKLESERVLFAIDNVEKPASELSHRNWQITSKASALLKSEEEKTTLQNQIKLNREKLGNVKKEAEAMNGKLAKMNSQIQVEETELQKETLAVEEMNIKLQNSLHEKELLLEVKENGRYEFESMLLEYQQSLFEADLKEEEIKVVQEELLMETRKVEELLRTRDEVTQRKTELVEAMARDTSFVSDKVEAALHSLRTSIVELNTVLELSWDRKCFIIHAHTLTSPPSSHLQLIKCELNESSSANTQKKVSKLEIGSPIIVIEAPMLLKTAASVPCLRANEGLVKPGDVGRIVSRKPMDVWAVRLSIGRMFNGMMDPEMIRMAQEQMSRMSPAELARIQQQMMSNPDLMRMATESMQNLRTEDFKHAAEQLKHARPEEMAEIGEKMANASPDELASMRARMDAQVSYEINGAEMLKKQGNELHSQGKYKMALEKYMRAKTNLKDIPTSKGRNLLLACSLNMMSCYLKTNQYEECIREGTEVLAYDAMNVKALYRRGQAYKEFGELGEAVSDLRKAHEASPGDETIADNLRDAEERLNKEGGGHRSRGVVIEEITEEATVSSDNCENSTSESSVSSPQKTNQSTTSRSANLAEPQSTNHDYFKALKDDPESIRSFQNFISRTDPETLSAINGGKAEGISPDMIKTATDVIGKMSPEELNKMFQLASSFQGPKNGASFTSGPAPSDLSPDMLKTATDMMGKMSPEDLQKMFEMASSLKGNEAATSSATGFHTSPGSVPPNMTPDMIKMATEMMNKMPTEERQKMFEMASSLRGQERASSTATSYSNGLRSDERNTRENLKVNGSDAGESSSSQHFNSNSLQSGFLNSGGDLQEQMRNQMKDPAMRQMFTSMMKNMNPEMMANMSEQFGFKLSREDAEKAQQAMSSLSPDTLDTMMKWADRVQRGVEGARKTKNWLLGRSGMALAIFMLLLAVVLHWFGFIGK